MTAFKKHPVFAFAVLAFSFLFLPASTALGAWNLEAVDAPRGFWLSSMRLDSSGNPVAAYGDDHLYYAVWDGLSWNIETVDSAGDVGRYTAITLDANDKAHISYLDFANHNLKYTYAD